MPPARTRPQLTDTRFRMVNGTFLLPRRWEKTAGLALHLSLRERSDCIGRCNPGEGLRSIDRPRPLTRLASHDARRPLPDGERWSIAPRVHTFSRHPEGRALARRL